MFYSYSRLHYCLSTAFQSRFNFLTIENTRPQQPHCLTSGLRATPALLEYNNKTSVELLA
jgi:hypothetical protein